MRIKCPNCGSSTQIELVWQDTDNYGTTHTYEYECGCGCAFEVNFIVKKIQKFCIYLLTNPHKYDIIYM